jgi:Cu(I)/Ag(I) efflux system membrane protein CusA/SilA
MKTKLALLTVTILIGFSSTIVASLLPIMWSHRQGAEVMQPLATPVIGGMISSLIHILIVTPVIFLWLRGREFKKSSLSSSLG